MPVVGYLGLDIDPGNFLLGFLGIDCSLGEEIVALRLIWRQGRKRIAKTIAVNDLIWRKARRGTRQVVEDPSQARQILHSVGVRITSQPVTQGDFHCLVSPLRLTIRLRMICRTRQECHIKLLKECLSKRRHKLLVSVRDERCR